MRRPAPPLAPYLAMVLVLAGGLWCQPAAADPAAPPDLLALEGDAEFGAYLAGECLACHRTDDAGDTIPVITGWPAPDFATALHAYRAGHRTHPAMQMIAGRLSDEEIAALAAYFQGLGN